MLWVFSVFLPAATVIGAMQWYANKHVGDPFSAIGAMELGYKVMLAWTGALLVWMICNVIWSRWKESGR